MQRSYWVSFIAPEFLIPRRYINLFFLFRKISRETVLCSSFNFVAIHYYGNELNEIMFYDNLCWIYANVFQVPTFFFIVNYIFTRHSKDLKAALLGHTLSFGLNGVFVGKFNILSYSPKDWAEIEKSNTI